MSKNENNIECVEIKYRVKAPSGMIVDVVSTKQLSARLTHELLEEDNEVNSFFANHKIMGIRQMVTIPTKNHQEPEVTIKSSLKKGIISPMQRLNEMLKMKGEFTRRDYEQHILNMHHVKIEKYISHKDIQNAINIHRIEMTEGKVGKLMRYKVLDPEDVDENLYKILLRDRKVQIDALH